jgi:hypothetical protein
MVQTELNEARTMTLNRRRPATRPSRAARESGLAPDAAAGHTRQDTPGRPKSASSRQQTRPIPEDEASAAKHEAEKAYSDDHP